MKNFVGIDLGTTNSAICSYDGRSVKIWKSPEQNDVTPSAVYIDRRGNKFIGKRAYDNAPYNPDNAAVLFKRLMGTGTKITLAAAKTELTPEECSCEVLKTLFGYLPEEIRNDPERGVVITVPAAFNQMQKDATVQAARMAGLGRVALMQEPVAAVMSVMRGGGRNGVFLIFDLGGGTLDVAVAESANGRVSLLSHGGIAMCGGRDFDRALMDNVVRPWLRESFSVPDDIAADPKFKSFMRLAAWAAERAKIELSSKKSSVISLSESEARCLDLEGNEMYLDMDLRRETFDELIKARVEEAVNAARDTLSRTGLSCADIERIVFVGGPTNYKPLRDKVCFMLGIEGNTDVNPMTAVAEGAAIFAESIDWSKEDRSRKSSRGAMTVQTRDLKVSFAYVARTPDAKGRIGVRLESPAPAGTEFKIDCLDTGWTSGLMPLSDGRVVPVTLDAKGENRFRVSVFDSAGNRMRLPDGDIVITRTAAAIDAIPASHSIAVEVISKAGGRSELDFLVRAGDPLPKKGRKVFKAAESLRAGSDGSLNIRLWEGEIADPVSDNRAIGVLKICGTDFDEGVIPAGSDLECSYEITDAGNIRLEVDVPSIGSVFHSNRNFYSRQEAQIDFSQDRNRVLEETDCALERMDEMMELVDDERLASLRDRLSELKQKALSPAADLEDLQEAMETVLESRRVLAECRGRNQDRINGSTVDELADGFRSMIGDRLDSERQSAFDAAVADFRRDALRSGADLEDLRKKFLQKIFGLLWGCDWFVKEQFLMLVRGMDQEDDDYAADKLGSLAVQGFACLDREDIPSLRDIVFKMVSVSRYADGDGGSGAALGMADIANIMRG